MGSGLALRAPRNDSGFVALFRDLHRDRVARREGLLEGVVELLVEVLLRVLGQLLVLFLVALAPAGALLLRVLFHGCSPFPVRTTRERGKQPWSRTILVASGLEILEHLDVLADVAGGELCDVHGLAVLRTCLDEALLDLQELAVALELALDVVLVESVAGFFLLQLLDHRRVLLVGLRRGAGGALRRGGAGRLQHRAQHLGQALLLVGLELRELLHVLVLRLLQGDLARLQRDRADHHGLLQPLLLGLAEARRAGIGVRDAGRAVDAAGGAAGLGGRRLRLRRLGEGGGRERQAGKAGEKMTTMHRGLLSLSGAVPGAMTVRRRRRRYVREKARFQLGRSRSRISAPAARVTARRRRAALGRSRLDRWQASLGYGDG